MELILVILLAAHGFTHLYGFASEQFLVNIKEMAWQKIVFVSPRLAKVIGVFWAVAWVAFWLAAIGIIFAQDWWRMAAIVGVVISQVLIVLYFKYAWWGTISNLIIIAAVFWLI